MDPYDRCTAMNTFPDKAPGGPEYRLFDSGGVGTAAFFCGPLAGAILIAVNYGRMEKAGKAVLALTLGLIATALYILIMWDWKTAVGSLGRLEQDAFKVLFGLLMWIAAWQVAKEEQGDAVKEHTARGGQLESRWMAFWLGAVSSVVLLLVIGAADYAYKYRKMVVIGTKDQILYSGFASKADAQALGNALKSNGYLQDRGSSVLVTKALGSTTISFVVQDGVWNQPGILSHSEELAREIAPAVGGLPVQVRLVDSHLNVEAVSLVGEARFEGSDGIYYEGSATKAEAQALGRQFESMGFFRGKGANVFLIKHDESTILSFVVVGEKWKDPRVLKGLDTIARSVAPTIGGLPIEVHLVNTDLQPQKVELITAAGEQ